MSHYPPYAAYKDSGIEWIGQVPEHWKLKRLRHIAVFNNSNVDKKRYEDQKEVKLCNYTDVYYNEFITSALDFMVATASDAEIEKFRLKKSDVIITKDSEDPKDIGIPALVLEDMDDVICGYHLTVIKANEIDLSGFIHRSIEAHSTKAHFFVESPGITRFGLNQDAIGDIPICVPPKEEYMALTEAINQETAHIDTLIAKKTHFIELLKEKRQALITHLVTKGLNTDVPMKDSGIEWIGQVPEHWEVKPLKFIVSCNDESLSEKIPGTTPISYVDISSVTYGKGIEYSEDMLFENAPSRARRKAKNGDVIVSTVRTYLKAVASVEEEYSNCIFSTGFAVLRARNEKLQTNFLKWLVLNELFIQAVESHSEGLSYPAINATELINLEVVVPSFKEQAKIAELLDHETAHIDTLIAKTEHSIELLKERRSAFITAAVTGQIDCRGNFHE